ncbi:hypothetical protein ES702_01263 [subsurface metagenome]
MKEQKPIVTVDWKKLKPVLIGIGIALFILGFVYFKYLK